jgi:hypothetical protein
MSVVVDLVEGEEGADEIVLESLLRALPNFRRKPRSLHTVRRVPYLRRTGLEQAITEVD